MYLIIMENKRSIVSLTYALFLTALVLNCLCDEERKINIVYLGDLPRGYGDQESSSIASAQHHSILAKVLGSVSLAKESLVYSYQRSLNGFAARLTAEEAARISKMEEVVSVIPNRVLQLHTTRSWDFMGLISNGENSEPGQEGDVIVGILDSGIWPEHESFSDEGFSDPPAKWKGTCKAENFTCNKKLVGARFYNSNNTYDANDIKSPRDTSGHGTHTSSTAAGRKVGGASYLGLAKGVARGGVPNARIAMYKVCWSGGWCPTADILKAFDDAIADGVDIISVSLGSSYPFEYFKDVIAIGAFHAMKNGILTSNSAGNDGPRRATVSNIAPWTLTVAASTIDRKFVTKVLLGNGQIFYGVSVNNFDLNGNGTALFPLVYGGGIANYTGGYDPDLARFCDKGGIDAHKVAGKIILCDGFFDGSTILLRHGLGTIIFDDSPSDAAYSFPLPATVLGKQDGLKILDYIRSTKNPVATILVGEEFRDISAPIVASFSSRGPNPRSPDILKPDITAPGVDILAAWSPLGAPSIYEKDTRSLKYNVISGTSMSAPHASGAAGYIKAVHPDWSPAAIKSALMTTANSMDLTKNTDREFAYGAGHINPTAAVNPGLIFDAYEADYVKFLCKEGYNSTTLKLITDDNRTCEGILPGRAWDLNYPSFSLNLDDGQEINATFTRTVTNVGHPSTYNASLYTGLGGPVRFNVTVEPSSLSFSSTGEKKSFKVRVTGPRIRQLPIVSVVIVWSDGVHEVKTPLVVYNYIRLSPYDNNEDTVDSSNGGAALIGGKPKLRAASGFCRGGIAGRCV